MRILEANDTFRFLLRALYVYSALSPSLIVGLSSGSHSVHVCVYSNSIFTYHALWIQRKSNVRNLFSTLRQCKGSSQTECSKCMFVRKTQSQNEKEKANNNTWTSESLKVESAPWSRTPRPTKTQCKLTTCVLMGVHPPIPRL